MATKVSKLRKCSMKTLVFHFCIPNSKHKLGAHWNRPAAAVGRNSPLRPVKALLHQPESVQFSVQNSELARLPSLPNSWFIALLELEKCGIKQERPKNLKPKKKKTKQNKIIIIIIIIQNSLKRRGPKRRASIMIAFRTSMNTTNKKGAIVLVVLVTRPHLEEYFQTVMWQSGRTFLHDFCTSSSSHRLEEEEEEQQQQQHRRDRNLLTWIYAWEEEEEAPPPPPPPPLWSQASTKKLQAIRENELGFWN